MRANRKIKETEDTEEEVAGMGGKTVEVPWRIYAAHTLSTWGDNAWWFAGGCCGFDGGDCCDNTGEGWDNYCSLCECLEMPETTEGPWWTTEGPMETTEEPSGTSGDDCAAPHWFGDGYCDDENNTPECGFDGGDCCDNEMEGYTNYCNVCECLEYPETTEAPANKLC